MVRKFILAAAVLAAAMVPSYAKTLSVPANDPVATVTIPDTWEIEKTDFGFSAASPDEDVNFFVEYASASRVEKMLALNDEWMKEQEIVPKGKPEETEGSIGGLPAKMFTYAATDPDGDTVIEFILIPGGKGRMILLTLWGSEEARKDNMEAIQAISASIKAVN